MAEGNDVRRSFLNQRFSGSFSGLDGFLRNRKKWKDKNAVEKELKKLKSYALHAPVKNKFPRRRIKVQFEHEIYTSDLKDISSYASVNNGYTFLLIVLDCFTKKAYVRPIRDKSSKSMIPAFASILRESKATPTYLYTDQGSEYLSSDFQAFLKQHNIKHYNTFSIKKAAIAERYIRTLFAKLQRYMTERNTFRFIDKLPDFVKALNSTYHRSIGMAPNAFRPEDTFEVWQRMYRSYLKDYESPRKPDKFRTGDYVRVSVSKLRFEKGK